MKKVMVIIILLSIILVGCTTNVPDQSSLDKKFCESAADCVAASCCHAGDAVNKDFAPDCSDVFCSASCEPDTLDCGQGHIECVENTCEVIKDKNIDSENMPQ